MANLSMTAVLHTDHGNALFSDDHEVVFTGNSKQISRWIDAVLDIETQYMERHDHGRRILINAAVTGVTFSVSRVREVGK